MGVTLNGSRVTAVFILFDFNFKCKYRWSSKSKVPAHPEANIRVSLKLRHMSQMVQASAIHPAKALSKCINLAFRPVVKKRL